MHSGQHHRTCSVCILVYRPTLTLRNCLYYLQDSMMPDPLITKSNNVDINLWHTNNWREEHHLCYTYLNGRAFVLVSSCQYSNKCQNHVTQVVINFVVVRMCLQDSYKQCFVHGMQKVMVAKELVERLDVGPYQFSSFFIRLNSLKYPTVNYARFGSWSEDSIWFLKQSSYSPLFESSKLLFETFHPFMVD